MAKLAAEVYGEALFDLAVETDSIDAWAEQIKTAELAFSENPEFLELLTHPKITKEEKLSVVEAVFKDRVDDALAATRAAVEEGIVPGGGVAYIRATAALEGMKGANDDQTTGIQIVKRAIEEPLRQIVANAGGEGSVVVNKVREGEGTFGYNARDDKYEDMMAAGIIDPTKVARVALENAASIASMFLTTECVLAEKKSEQPAMPAMPGGGMGGMM